MFVYTINPQRSHRQKKIGAPQQHHNVIRNRVPPQLHGIPLGDIPSATYSFVSQFDTAGLLASAIEPNTVPRTRIHKTKQVIFLIFFML